MLKRTIKLILYLIVSSFIIFVLVEKTSGNPAILYLQRHGYTSITQENIEAAQHKLGLGQHFLLRYIDWIGHALTGNLGYSFSTNEPVTTMIMEAVIPTLILIVVSSCIMLPLGYMVGYFIETRPHTRYANGIRGFAQVMTSMPEYWLAILFIYYLGVRWQLLPFVGSDSWQHFVLPIFTIVVIEGCHILLMTSHLIAQTLDNDAYQLAQLRHYSLKARIIVQIKEIFAPLMTISINSVIHLIGKVVILEVIFSMSGIGKLLINAINQRDYPLIQGIVVFIIVLIMFINYLGDIIILNNEPRLRRRHTKRQAHEKRGVS
ncbi:MULTISPECIES: ABC transporter permease [unclassified Staphylococcus]|uniref:ABC transporter permease n=1 Tax=unclassified Staphylococcus TaxID=91994 RepID=UPI0008A23BF9|nr:MULTISPECIES: ABC transporter permease [unclassified Staphylococcus]OFS54220.1 peptide ABC transporter permease [Staphylococcus sp. HMSC065C09]OHQ11872.1 peptide ABC transporter permease [Staphylococcus sp. HMSC064E03]OLF65575.1 peptide ABC transporter permease [Staphylococcus sp. MB377]